MNIAVVKRNGDANTLRIGKVLGTGPTLFLMKMVGDEDVTVERLLSRRANANFVRCTDDIWCAGS